MKPFYINVYQDQRGQWYGGQFASRRRAIKAASTVSSKCVGRLRVTLKVPIYLTENAVIKSELWNKLSPIS